MELLLIRNHKANNFTFGTLFINDQFECYTLEDPVRQVFGRPVSEWKIKAETAIPIGRYELIINLSVRFGIRLPLLLKVDGFEGIRIHKGNKTINTEGCILVGDKFSLGDQFLASSKAAFDRLMLKLESTLAKGEKVYITIA